MNQTSSASSTFNAGIITPPLSVSSFMPSGTSTPGNVAVCLSGGGSRAMSAGMGQLLALETITAGAQNASLLAQTKALSTVSGGSWIGVPFTYLPSGTSDVDFLGGPYVEPSALTTHGLGRLSKGCVASGITSGFSLVELAAMALILRGIGTPTNMLWQILIARTFLKPYGLYQKTSYFNLVPTGWFSFDAGTVAKIQGANKDTPLATEKASVVAKVSGQTRPYHVCNMAMAVKVGSGELLAPVQGTPFFTGIVSSPPGAVDADGRAVGGGGVTSFAFSSAPASVDVPAVAVQQARQWTLTDIIGTSSAAFAELLISIFGTFASNPLRFVAALRSARGNLEDFFAEDAAALARLTAVIEERIKTALSGDLAAHRASLDISPTDLVPSYQYWPITGAEGGEKVDNSWFADAGSLDNTGVASALSYADIDNVISFVNSETPLSVDAKGTIVVDGAIPPLFGYQPYDEDKGYVPYSEPLVSKSNAPFQHNQIFASEQFSAFLQGLWQASGSGKQENAPVLTQTLTTLPNAWFGVAGGKTIKVLWVYLDFAHAWSSQLSHDVSHVVDKLISRHSFPHYNTLDTDLDAKEINLLANLTAWTVMSNKDAFTAMYAGTSPAR